MSWLSNATGSYVKTTNSYYKITFCKKDYDKKHKAIVRLSYPWLT